MNVAAGKAVNNPSANVSFPTDNSNQSKAARIIASLITLQNLNGPGKGCPAASTTFLVSYFTLKEFFIILSVIPAQSQLKAIQR